jgi:hypothetical protein
LVAKRSSIALEASNASLMFVPLNGSSMIATTRWPFEIACAIALTRRASARKKLVPLLRSSLSEIELKIFPPAQS